MGDVGIDGKIVLKWRIKNWTVTAFKFFGIMTSGGLPYV
jgi:activator of HSP90 ATPase